MKESNMWNTFRYAYNQMDAENDIAKIISDLRQRGEQVSDHYDILGNGMVAIHILESEKE